MFSETDLIDAQMAARSWAFSPTSTSRLSNRIIGTGGGGPKALLYKPFDMDSLSKDLLSSRGLGHHRDGIIQSIQNGERQFKIDHNIGLTSSYSIGGLPVPLHIAIAKYEGFRRCLETEGISPNEFDPSALTFNDWIWALGKEAGPVTIINQPRSADDCSALIDLYMSNDPNTTHLYSINGNVRPGSLNLLAFDYTLVNMGKIDKHFDRDTLAQILERNTGKIAGGIDGIEALQIGFVQPGDCVMYEQVHGSLHRDNAARVLSGNITAQSLEKGSWTEVGSHNLQHDAEGKQLSTDDEVLKLRALCLGIPEENLHRALFRNEVRRTKIEETPLPSHLYPFHLDSQGEMPSMITNGGDWKEPLARSIGCGAIRDSHIKEAIGAAEDAFHAEFGDAALGPAMLKRSPYPLVLAAEKLEAGRKVLEKDGLLESFFTTDTTYRLRIPNTDVDYTLHKPKTEEDIETITRLMIEASESGKAHLSAVAGIARYDEKTKEKEFFTTEVDLGIVQPFETSTLVNRLRKNASKPLGTSTFDMQDFLIKTQSNYQVQVSKYEDVNQQPRILRVADYDDLRYNPALLRRAPSDAELENIGIHVSNDDNNHAYKRVGSAEFSISGDRSSGNDLQSWLYMMSLGYIPR